MEDKVVEGEADHMCSEERGLEIESHMWISKQPWILVLVNIYIISMESYHMLLESIGFFESVPVLLLYGPP